MFKGQLLSERANFFTQELLLFVLKTFSRRLVLFASV